MARLIDQVWLERQLGGAPPELAARSLEFIERQAGPIGSERLAGAAGAALAAAIEAAPGRRAALDLLAADALVTLALAAAAEESPGDLERFAACLRQTEGAAP